MESTSANIIPFSSQNGIASKAAAASRMKEVSEIDLINAKAFSSLWESAEEGMRLTDEKGTTILVNPAFCRMVEKEAEEIVGRHFSCIYNDSENIEQMTLAYEKSFEDHKVNQTGEHRFILWNKRTIDIEIKNCFIQSFDGRELLLSRFYDVTAKKMTTQALAESESKYRGLFANSVMPMFQSTTDGRLINANRALLKLLGYDSFYELADIEIARDTYAHPEERKAIMEMLNQKGFIVNAEIRLKRKNGRVITVLESARTLVDDKGNIIGYEGVMEDITARKAMERKLQEYVWALERSKNALSELNAQKDKLFSILSHDLRSPFSSILGFCDILLKENDQLSVDDRLQFIAYIQEAAQDQLALVNKLLDWSRLESGRVRMERVELDLFEIIKKSMNSLAGLARQKQVTLENKLNMDVMVYGDKQLLSQVFGNLIGNSLKFTPAGGTISVELIEEQHTQWIIGVRDTGIGIPKDDINKLFKIEEKYTRKGLGGERGTGLGLPVVYEIVQKHHGSIEVKSKIGTGTLFVITFPKSRVEDGETILVVDDEAGTRVLHSRYLKTLKPNANILHTSNVKEVQELAKEFHPVFIICDNDLNEIDTPEMLRNLKAGESTNNIPVIVVAKQASESNCEILKKYGATFVVRKPVMPEKLSEILNLISADKKSAVA
jgi:PAS domain S-box-containing protein